MNYLKTSCETIHSMRNLLSIRVKNDPNIFYCRVARMCFVNITMLIGIFYVYTLKTSLSEDQMYRMIQFYRDCYTDSFSFVVEHNIISVESFIRVTQMIIPLSFWCTHQILTRGCFISFRSVFMATCILYVVDSNMRITKSLIEVLLNINADVKHRLFDFICTVYGMKSSVQVLMDSVKVSLSHILLFFVYVHIRNTIDMCGEMRLRIRYINQLNG